MNLHAQYDLLPSIQVPTPTLLNTTDGTRGTAAPMVGDVLSAITGPTTPTGANLSYHWTRTDADGVETAIPDAHGPSYTTIPADVGARVRATVTATPTAAMSGYSTGQATSEHTGAVQAAPTPPPTPTPTATIPDPALVIQANHASPRL